MARIEDIERRLLNWARWRSGVARSGMGYGRISMEHRVDGEGYDAQAVIPTIDVEASTTDIAVSALASHLRATVEIVYLDPGGMRHKAARLCCSEATIKTRIWEAHRQLSAWFADRAARQRDARARIESLQRAARP